MSATALKPLRAPARLAARKLARAAAHRVLERAGDGARQAAERALQTGRDALESTTTARPPVQAAVDVAVPLDVAWDQWMAFEAFTEGVQRIESVRRKGKRLTGRAGGQREWKAEVVDERKQEAFAWRSTAGTDCAGLVTFHRLSERLTRIELDLDVLPTRPLDALLLVSGLAGRRATAELRRFKAQVEFINPDVYESDGETDGSHRDAGEEDGSHLAAADKD